MNIQLQQLYAEGKIDLQDYRTIILWTVLVKLAMAIVLGVCAFIVT